MFRRAVPRTRRFRRITVHVAVEVFTDTGHRREMATTLGAGGLFIRTEEPLAPGSALKLRFQLPGSEDQHELPGRVVWSNAAGGPESGTPGMGIEFTDRAASARLARALDRLER